MWGGITINTINFKAMPTRHFGIRDQVQPKGDFNVTPAVHGVPPCVLGSLGPGCPWQHIQENAHGAATLQCLRLVKGAKGCRTQVTHMTCPGKYPFQLEHHL